MVNSELRDCSGNACCHASAFAHEIRLYLSEFGLGKRMQCICDVKLLNN